MGVMGVMVFVKVVGGMMEMEVEGEGGGVEKEGGGEFGELVRWM